MAKTITRPKPRPVRAEVPRTKFGRPAIVAAPAPRPADPLRPHGVLDHAGIEDLCEVAAAAWSDSDYRRSARQRGLRRLLAHLLTFPGQNMRRMGVKLASLGLAG